MERTKVKVTSALSTTRPIMATLGERSRLGIAFVIVTRLALGAILLWTGIPKLMRPDEFLTHVQGYGLLSPKLAATFAMMLPGIELVIGFSLIAGLFSTSALLASTIIFSMFVIAVTTVLIRGLSIDCGCGLLGTNDQLSKWTMLRGILLLVWALTACVFSLRQAQRQRTQTGQGTNRSPGVGVSDIAQEGQAA